MYEISAYAFVTHIDPSEVKVEVRQWMEDEPKLFDITIDLVVPLSLPLHN